MTDFKSSTGMYAIAIIIIAFIVAQSMFFIIKSWKHGKELGIKKETLVNTVTSSILFTIAPAISILVTVFVLAKALGIVLPWIRLTVIGNLAYETVAAETALNNLGGSLSSEITDPVQFSTVAWAMTIGAIFPLTFLPLVCKKLQKAIGGAVNKDEKSAKVGDIISASAFIGIISAFIARAINGCSTQTSTDGIKLVTESSGFISISTLVCAIVLMLLFTLICKKASWGAKAEPFAMPLAMFCAMGFAVLLTKVVPADISGFTWYTIGEELKTLL